MEMSEEFSQEKFLELRKTDPEAYYKIIGELALRISPEDAAENYKRSLRAKAQLGVTTASFTAYYELIHGNQITEHNQKPLEECFKAHEEGEIFEYMGFRGCRKTSTFDVTLGSFLHGHFPEKTGIITGANDPNSKLIAKSIAQIIEFHPEFKACFPHIAIDKDRGWGAEGYWIIDTRMSREQWVAQQAKVNDPSFVGGGYQSSEINGKHPSLYLIVDDLHDIDSSASKTEREQIKTKFLTQILKTIIREKDKILTWVIITGVPFAIDDTYAVLRDAGGTRFVSVPVMRKAQEGEGVYIDGMNPKTKKVYEDIVGWWNLTWPENFGAKAVINSRSEGKFAFWQMMMLDLTSAKHMGLTYYTYEPEDIDKNWPTHGGVDPSFTMKDKAEVGKTNSSFSMAHLQKIPRGGAVISGGVVEKCTLPQAANHLAAAQSRFPNYSASYVENVGMGLLFIETVRRINSKLRILPSDLGNIRRPGEKSAKVRSKHDRVVFELAPWLENATIFIARRAEQEQDQVFLQTLKDALDNFYELEENTPDPRWDVLDSVYHAVKSMPDVLRIAPAQEELATVFHRTKQKSPLSGISSHKGY